jgi:hypothetical protein
MLVCTPRCCRAAKFSAAIRSSSSSIVTQPGELIGLGESGWIRPRFSPSSVARTGSRSKGDSKSRCHEKLAHAQRVPTGGALLRSHAIGRERHRFSFAADLYCQSSSPDCQSSSPGIFRFVCRIACALGVNDLGFWWATNRVPQPDSEVPPHA